MAVVSEDLHDRPTGLVDGTVGFCGEVGWEVFSFERVCASQLNVRFYQQLPSILTGIGLLFTFLAILIGLRKLHANGSEIEGLQGLINGLVGKFVTSIVGLACGNAFPLLEKSLWHREAGRHRQVVARLDEMFPQQVQDDSARERVSKGDAATDCKAVSWIR